MFNALTTELNKLNVNCHLNTLLDMVKEINNSLTADMDQLTKLQIIININNKYSNGY